MGRSDHGCDARALHRRGGHDDGARIDPAAIAQAGSDVLLVF